MSVIQSGPGYRYKPFKFFFLTLLITWVAFFIAAYFSYNENTSLYKFIFIFVGLLTPFTVAMFMIFGSGSDGLKRDFWNRLTNLKLIKPQYLLAILLIMPCSVLLATAISLLFGQPIQQFAISPGFTLVGDAAIPLIIAVILAPAFEELAWRGYGVDSLAKEERSLFTSTLIFALLWDLWHVPLFLIKGYYQYEILQANPLYALNFFVSVFPVAFLANWLYYKNNRNILINILFHCTLNLFSTMFITEQFTKCIVTVILLMVSVVVILASRKSFWMKPAAGFPSASPAG